MTHLGSQVKPDLQVGRCRTDIFFVLFYFRCPLGAVISRIFRIRRGFASCVSANWAKPFGGFSEDVGDFLRSANINKRMS